MYTKYGAHHERSVNRQRLDHIADVRRADYAAAKAADPQAVAEYERQVELRRVKP